MRENENAFYVEILRDNVETSDIVRKGTREEMRLHFKERHENSLYELPGFAYAMDRINLIGTRFMVQGIDITSAMREKIYRDEYGKDNKLWQVYLEAIHEYEERHYKDYLRCVMGQVPEEYTQYTTYIELAKKVNSFMGSNSDKAYADNPREFRELVKDLIEARKHCMLVANFTKKSVPKEKWNLLKEETITYEEALELAQEIIDNIESVTTGENFISYSKADRYDDVVGYVYEEGSKIRAQIMERYITRFLEQAGVDRRIYTKYMKNPLYQPNKKLALVLALFCEPYCNLDVKDDTELAIAENVEQFMNQNSLSVKSKFATITEYDNMLDDELMYLVEDGLTLDMLAYMLKHFARTEKDFK